MKDTDQNDRRLLQRIKLENLLSFGPGTIPLELENLNVLIGPNAAGKSNLIEALSLLRATPVSATASNMDLSGIVRRGGRNCSNAYKKGERSFEILSHLTPGALANYLPSFVRARSILDTKL